MEVAEAVAQAHQQEWAYVLAATARVAGDLTLAEDCVQDAYAQALRSWPTTGVPQRPGGWLTTVATRRALEHRRRAATLARKLPLLAVDEDLPPADGGSDTDSFPDDRLRLVFTCCHPALSRDAQVGLTLRLVCGLSSAEVARAFLVKEATMQARITRAKKKIAEARIPYRIPRPEDLPERVEVVLDVVHLVYSSGYTAGAGDELVRHDLAARGLDLARMLHQLLPDDREVTGLLALLLLTQARQPARVDESGLLVLLEQQDRSRWDAAAMAQGLSLVHRALAGQTVGRYCLMAAIAAVHAEAPSWAGTDWGQLVGLYDLLLHRWPSPVVALNRAVAVSFAVGPGAALRLVDDLSSTASLATYPYLAATRADLLRRLDRVPEAILAYQEALLLTENRIEAGFLAGRVQQLQAERDRTEG